MRPKPEFGPARPEGPLDLAAAWDTALRHRRFVLGVLAASLAAGLALAYLLPPTYQAGAVLLPPSETDVFGSLQSARKALSSFSAFGLLSQTYTPADEYQAILKSETVHRAVAARFGLMSVYHVANMDAAVKALRRHARVNLSADGSISVVVEDPDRRRAADLANAFPEELDRFNQARRTSRARAQRAFLERRMAVAQAELKHMEEAARAFGEREHAPVMSGSDKASAEGAASLLSRKAALDVRRQILRAYLDPGSDELAQIQQEISSLDAEISKLPSIEMEGARLLRDLKVQEELFLLLRAEEEEARVKESFDVPTVEIMDRAHVPDARSAPVRKLVVAGTLLAGLVVALGGALVMEARAGSRVWAGGLSG